MTWDDAISSKQTNSTYSVRSNSRRRSQIKCTRGKLSKFVKIERLFLGYSLIKFNWTWGIFSQNLQFDPPLKLHKKGYEAFLDKFTSLYDKIFEKANYMINFQSQKLMSMSYKNYRKLFESIKQRAKSQYYS